MSRTAYYNGVIYTSDDSLQSAEAFIVEDGRFVLVGSNDEITDCEDRIDLEGKCVLPGLVDSHCHMLAGVVEASVNMLFVDQSVKPYELGNVLAGLLKKEKSDRQVIVAMGIDLTVGAFSADNIDRVFPDKPVIVFCYDGHALLLNTKAMEILGINKDTKDPDENSYYARDDDGNPTGLVIEISAMKPCKKLIATNNESSDREAIIRFARGYSALGYTTIFEAMSVDDEETDMLEALKSLDEEGMLPFRIVTSFGYSGEEGIDTVRTVELMKANRERFSSDHVYHNTLKIISDGTLEEHSALLFEPYLDGDFGSGSEMVDKEDMEKALKLAAAEGFMLHVHAIGDKAISRVIDAYIGLGKTRVTKTIAHNQVYRVEDIERMIRQGDICFQTTPHWMKGDEYTLRCLGRERFIRQIPAGTMQRNGVAVSFGSDSCLEEETANAFLGMYYACIRGNEALGGEQNLPPESESIARKDSLYAYTINGARQLMLEKETGSITAGKSADFIIVDRDIFKCPIEELKDTKVLQTYFCGKHMGDEGYDQKNQGKD